MIVLSPEFVRARGDGGGLMTIEHNKSSAVREYLDTQHVFKVWFKP